MTTTEERLSTQSAAFHGDHFEEKLSDEPEGDVKMEWRIQIDQCVFHEFINAGLKVDLVDAAIVSGIQKLQDEDSGALLKTDDGLVWVGHKWFTRQYPLLGLTERGLRSRLANLCKTGLLQRTHILSPGAGFRKKACYRTSTMYQELIKWWDEKRDILVDNDLHPNTRKAKLQRLQESKPPVELQQIEVSDPRPRGENGRFVKGTSSPSEPPEVSSGTDVSPAPSESCHGRWHDDAVDSLFGYHESEEPRSARGNATTVASPRRGFWYPEYYGERYPASHKNWRKLIDKLGGDEEEALRVMHGQYVTKTDSWDDQNVKDYAWLALQFVDSEYYRKDLERQKARR